MTLNGSLENGNNKSGSRLNGLKNFTFEIYEISNRAVSREIPTGNSREFPEKSCSRKFPGIISGSREFSGIFYVLKSENSEVSPNFH